MQYALLLYTSKCQSLYSYVDRIANHVSEIMLLYCGSNRDQKPKLVPVPLYVSLTFLNRNVYIINILLIISVSTSDCIAFLVVLIVEWQIENRLEGSNDAWLKHLPLNMPGVTRKIRKPPWLG
jgi:hypothetical protein